jgi:hypothetical protein
MNNRFLSSGPCKLDRKIFLAEQIAIIVGMSSSGKGMMGPIISSFKRVENYIGIGFWENLLRLEYLNKIDKDATDILLRLSSDNHLNYQFLSRDTNFRFFDATGPFFNPNTIRTFLRLFYKDGDHPIKQIKNKRPIQLLMSHDIMPVIKPVFRAWGDRLNVVHTVRHPLYMINSWYKYIDRAGKYRYGNDPREQTLTIEYNGQTLPWFASGWEEQYLSMNNMDRVIHTLDLSINSSKRAYDELEIENKNRIIEIPFEKFVLNPSPYICKLEKMLDTGKTSRTLTELRKQKCPRKLLSDGVVLQKRYRKKLMTNELDEFQNRVSLVEEHASEESIVILKKMCANYLKRHQLIDVVPEYA